MLPRIVVTGVGCITPAGMGIDSLRKTLHEGISHTKQIQTFDTTDLSCKVGASIIDFDPKTFFDHHELKRLDKSSQYFVAAGMMALEDSQLKLDSINQNRIGILEGSSIGNLDSILKEHLNLSLNGLKNLNPFIIIKGMNGIGGSMLALKKKIKGLVVNFSNGSVSSASAIINAYNLLKLKEIDYAIAGGSEAPVNRNIFSIFGKAGALTSLNDFPEKASRPFDSTRNGLVLGDAGGCIFMERMETAIKRGAKIYAEVLSTCITNDSVNLIAPAEDGIEQANSIKLSLQKVKLNTDELDLIIAHGTSTILNDRLESLAIKKALGQHAYSTPVSALKSMLGHSLGACTAIELIGALIAIEDQFLPPTINLHNPDAECDLNYVPNHAVSKKVNTVLIKNSSFGGKNTAIVLRKFLKD